MIRERKIGHADLTTFKRFRLLKESEIIDPAWVFDVVNRRTVRVKDSGFKIQSVDEFQPVVNFQFPVTNAVSWSECSLDTLITRYEIIHITGFNEKLRESARIVHVPNSELSFEIFVMKSVIDHRIDGKLVVVLKTFVIRHTEPVTVTAYTEWHNLLDQSTDVEFLFFKRISEPDTVEQKIPDIQCIISNVLFFKVCFTCVILGDTVLLVNEIDFFLFEVKRADAAPIC